MLNPNFITKIINDSSDYGQFILEPLPPSFGNSLGNILRRTLLSSLKGAAITNININSVAHLFSTLKGVKESVLEIVLNMKRLRFKAPDKGPYKINLQVKGAGKIFGKDVEGEVEVINKDLYIAEVTDTKGKLNVEALVETGYGYSSTEERDKKEYGFIPVDAFFSPVTKVNFKVEEARVGRKSNFDRLTLEIWTDGTITPKEALKQIVSLLSNYFGYILSGRDVPAEDEGKPKAEGSKEIIDKKFSEIIIDELNLPSRVINALLRENIETVADLIKVGRIKLTTMKGVGKKSIELIEEELKKMQIELS